MKSKISKINDLVFYAHSDDWKENCKSLLERVIKNEKEADIKAINNFKDFWIKIGTNQKGINFYLGNTSKFFDNIAAYHLDWQELSREELENLFEWLSKENMF
ncbi:MAG: hypothetical protein ACOCT9_01585 [archaeon]